MENQSPPSLNKPYVVIVSILTLVLPAIGSAAEVLMSSLSWQEAIGKWFIFSAVGLRLFVAGVRQTLNPAFTAKEIFRLTTNESLPIIRELGFANICFGLIGIISFFVPSWQIVSAFGSGLYYGAASVLHLVKKPAGANETFALVTDLFIFIVLMILFFIRL